MTATAIKRRGGTTVQHSTFTGLNREITIDDDLHTAVVHDGVTPGGHPLLSGAVLDTYAPLASPALTGNPTAPTQSPGNDSTRLATTAFVEAVKVALVGGAGAGADTLGEIETTLALKAPLASPTFTGTPAAPTAAPGTDTAQVATTGFVKAAVDTSEALVRPLATGGTGATTAITAWDALASTGTGIASSGTINLTTVTGPLISITGTTAVTAVTLATGAMRIARASGAFRLTASASLIVNGSTTASYTTNADDLLLFEGYASSVVRVWVINTPQYGLAPYPSGHLYHPNGVGIANDTTDATNDIVFHIGTMRDSADSGNIDALTSLIKQADATWVAGTNQGGRFYTTLADGTLHCYRIRNPSTGVVDGGFSDNASDPTGGASYPAGFTQYRRIGSIVRSGGTIRAFNQVGDTFRFVSPVADRSSTSAVAFGLLAVSVPSGFVLQPILHVAFAVATAGNITVGIGSATASAATVVAQGLLANAASTGPVPPIFFSDTSGRINFETVITSGTINGNVLSTLGWIDTRGRT